MGAPSTLQGQIGTTTYPNILPFLDNRDFKAGPAADQEHVTSEVKPVSSFNKSGALVVKSANLDGSPFSSFLHGMMARIVRGSTLPRPSANFRATSE